tara:strand:- start:292 stop:411 length:120 start_codon:yes stop_codon:yes gene_type:complete
MELIANDQKSLGITSRINENLKIFDQIKFKVGITPTNTS